MQERERGLIPLADWNLQRARTYADWERHETAEAPEPRPNGLACPHCGAELWDASPQVLRLTWPPKKAVECRECGLRGERLV